MQRRPSPSLLVVLFATTIWLLALLLPRSASVSPEIELRSVPTSHYTLTEKSPVLSLADVGLDESALDPTARPCQDFYRYACGGWVDRTKIPASVRGVFRRGTSVINEHNRKAIDEILESAATDPGNDPLTQQVGNVYGSCLDEASIESAGIAPIRPLIDQIDHASNAEEMAQAVAALHRMYVPVFFRVDPTIEHEAFDAGTAQAGASLSFRSRTVAALDVRGHALGLPAASFRDPNASIQATYRAYVEQLFIKLGARTADAKEAAEDVIRVESRLAEAESKVTPATRTLDRSALGTTAGHFAWGAYLDALGGDVVELHIAPQSLVAIDEILASESLEALRHYLVFSLVDRVALELASPFARESIALNAVVPRGMPEARLPHCRRITLENTGDAVANLYVEREFPTNSRLITWSMVGTIEEVLRARLRSESWLDEPTRSQAFEKIDQMALLIGYPSVEREGTYPTAPHSNLANLIVAASSRFDSRIAAIGKPVNRSAWDVSAIVANAYYDAPRNRMVFPAAILQPPFFKQEWIPAVNYGAIGSVIGHELTHAFIGRSSRFDGNGNPTRGWSPAMTAKFAPKNDCLVKQYSAYQASVTEHVDGVLTFEENAADVGGLKIAWEAWQIQRKGDSRTPVVALGYREDQLFFLAFAQSLCEKGPFNSKDIHSPGQFRVLGALADTPEFGDAFGCPKGTPMQPVESCSIW